MRKMRKILFWWCFILIIHAATNTLGLQCFNCLVDVNTPSYVDCKNLQNIKIITCPAGSLGCAVVRFHPKGRFAQFKRECIDKTSSLSGTNGYCERKKKNDTQPQYFGCNTCQQSSCNKILLK
ncbi:hypothetical protein HHI36_016549 [Cryptolaemus montrouzieri]|uniref:Protein quiver n=1 Tax=Cryptolaemus montrouzieri TaxID=559131 RepID=A0ABD2NKG8_9CUCU